MINKKISILYYLASICFYIIGIINLFDSGFSSSAIIWLCLGSAFLCFAVTSQNKDDGIDDKK